MNNNSQQEYDDDFTALLQAVWGEGFMSPGGTDEVDRILVDLDLEGNSILDIGCGLGGVEFHIAGNYPISHIIGIDVEFELIEKCQTTAGIRHVSDKTTFQHVSPGLLPFDQNTFDLVISKDSVIHIADKKMLANEVYRVLKPSGVFSASDWLAGYEGEPSPEMKAYVEAEGLEFGLANSRVYEEALVNAGFQDLEFQDRNDWYREIARQERDDLSGPLYNDLRDSLGGEYLDAQIRVWDLMIVVLDKGQLRPTNLRATKPA